MTLAIKGNLNATTPAPASGHQNVAVATDAGSPIANISLTDPNMVGDSGSGGKAGNVPAPAAGDAAAGKLLCASGLWVHPTGEVITVSGTSGTLAHTPVFIFGIFKNGQRLTSLGSSPDFSRSGTSLTFTVAAISGDFYEAVYLY